MRCLMFCIDVSSLLRETLGKGWEFCYADTPAALLELAHGGPVDLVCWKAGNRKKNMPELGSMVRQSRTLCNAANIAFGKSHRYEADMLALGHDDFIVLPADEQILKVRVLNALKRKTLVRSAREELWTTFVYRHSVLDRALLIFEVDLDTGQTVQMKTSEEAKKSFYALESFLRDEDTITRFHPDDRLMVLDTFSAQGLRRMLAQGARKREFEYRVRDKKGIWRWLKTCIHYEKDIFGGQRCFGYTKAAHHKTAERQLYEKALQESVYALFVIDPQNDLCRRFTHERSAESGSMCSYRSNYRKILHSVLDGKEYQRACEDFNIETMQEALSAGGRVWRHYEGRHSGDGTFRRLSCEFFHMEERNDYIVVLIWDVTDLYRDIQTSEKARVEKLQHEESTCAAKGQRLSRLSHDLRTPLNAVIGLTSIAQGKNAEPDVEKCLDDIQTASQVLLQTIDDILDVEKIDCMGLEIRPIPYTREQFVHVMDLTMRPIMEDRQLCFTYELACQISCISIDGARLDQILFNLLSNAAQFTPQRRKSAASDTTIHQRKGKGVAAFLGAGYGHWHEPCIFAACV